MARIGAHECHRHGARSQPISGFVGQSARRPEVLEAGAEALARAIGRGC